MRDKNLLTSAKRHWSWITCCSIRYRYTLLDSK